MGRARQLDVDDRLRHDRPQGQHEPAGLLDRDEVVDGAVHDEERRRAAVHGDERRRPVEDVAGGRDVTPGDESAHPRADPTGSPGPGEQLGERVRAVHRDAGEHGRVDGLEARLERRVVGGQSDQRREVTTGGSAGDHDAGRVAAVLGDVGADPGQRALAVDQVLRVPHRRAELVVVRDAHPAGSGEPVHEQPALGALPAADPRSAVDLEQHRGGAHLMSGAVDVEEVAAAGARGVPHLVDPDDGPVTEPERAQPVRDRPPRPRLVPAIERADVLVDDPGGASG